MMLKRKQQKLLQPSTAESSMELKLQARKLLRSRTKLSKLVPMSTMLSQKKQLKDTMLPNKSLSMLPMLLPRMPPMPPTRLWKSFQELLMLQLRKQSKSRMQQSRRELKLKMPQSMLLRMPRR